MAPIASGAMGQDESLLQSSANDCRATSKPAAWSIAVSTPVGPRSTMPSMIMARTRSGNSSASCWPMAVP